LHRGRRLTGWGGGAPEGREGAAGTPSAGSEAAAPAVGGAAVGDDAKMVGRGLWLPARVGEGAHGVQGDRPGVQAPAGVESRREASTERRPGLRWTRAQCGRPGSVSRERARPRSRTGANVPEAKYNLQRRVWTQSGAAPDRLQRPLVPRYSCQHGSLRAFTFSACAM
jgi:hypothetical protein